MLINNNLGHIEPDCNQCRDDATINRCTECGCQVCSEKADPDKQLVCDECERAVHLWCLKQPLDKTPDDDHDWYCDECRNETNDELLSRQQSHLQQRQQDTYSTTRIDMAWGYGMACASRSKHPHRNQVKSQTFGHIPQVAVGSWWRFRVQASEAGVHAPLVAGIHGSQSLGVYSLVFAALNPHDVDLGDEIYYTVNTPGSVRKRSGSKSVSQCDQKLQRDALALARNCPVPINEQYGASAHGPDRDLWKQGLPIRVLRSGNSRIPKHKRSRYLPKIGVRYDGLYKVQSYWPEAATNGHRVWRFLLRRDDKEPAPWTDAGRYRTKKLGLHQLQYPPGWCRQVAQKRFWTTDANIRSKQARSSSINDHQSKQSESNPIIDYYVIPETLVKLIGKDEANKQVWSDILAQRHKNLVEFRITVRHAFRCACCIEIVENDGNDMITTECGHNFCRPCLQQYLTTMQHQRKSPVCPLCRSRRFLSTGSLPETNSVLTEILTYVEQLLS